MNEHAGERIVGPARVWSDVSDKFGDQIPIECFQTPLAADTAVFDPAKGGFGQCAAKVIDVHHAGFKGIADLGRGLKRVREYIR